MPLQTGTKRREPEREMRRGNEGGRRGEMRGAREAEDGCEERRERDNALNTRGSCCALIWTLQRVSGRAERCHTSSSPRQRNSLALCRYLECFSEEMTYLCINMHIFMIQAVTIKKLRQHVDTCAYRRHASVQILILDMRYF